MKKPVLAAVLILSMFSLAAAHGGVQDDHHEATQGESNLAIAEQPCSNENAEWRNSSTIDGVDIKKSERCNPDNPNTVAAAVKGTNRVSMQTLMASGLARDAVVKGNDTDGDGDPDDITIKLELSGINEYNQSSPEYSIAPGIKPAFWAFTPKTRGMVEENSKAAQLTRMPSPSLRVEEGDNVTLIIENTHYMPHTVHLHGVDHPFNTSEGGDGVPRVSEEPIPPGESRSYSFSPREEGTMFYHCHVVPNVHVAMGLNGMFKVVEEEANNTVQTLNIGAGKVRHEDTADDEVEDEYDMVYQSIDKELHEIPQEFDDTREVSKQIHREYDITEEEPDYFLLNGKSFPYTLRESAINVEEDERYKLNVLNSGRGSLSLHTHGHKFKKTASDGVELENPVQRDVLSLSSAQRATLILNTTDDGLNSYGQGAWIFHDHREEAVTTDGISPGGTVSAIAYEDYRTENGMPETAMNLTPYFTEEYYEGDIPYFKGLDQQKFGEVPGDNITRVLTRQNLGGGELPPMNMKMEDGGLVVNENKERLPPGCNEINGRKTVNVKAGEEFAGPGNAFAYNQDNYSLETCQKVTIVLNNTDEVRHQWMLHGLPDETYPRGMYNIEADGGETVKGTFITPGEPQEFNLHCSLPQHEQKGMHGKITVGEVDDGNTDNRGSIFSTLLNLL